MDFGSISYVGRLSNTSFVDLLYSLQMQQETGLLYIRRDKVGKRIYYKNGRIIHIDSSLARESLSRQLIESGALTHQKASDLLKKAISQKTNFESQLIKENTFPRDTFIEILLTAIKVRLLEVFSWTEGQYAFLFDRRPAVFLEELPEPPAVEPLVLEAIRRYYQRPQLKSSIVENMDEVWRLTTDVGDIQHKLQLKSNEMQLVRKIDGQSNLEKVIVTSDMEMRTILSLLLVLKTFHFVQNGDQPEQSRQYEIPNELSTEEKIYAERLIETGPAMLERSPYKLLQVSREFNDTDLRRGYYSLASRYHQREIIDRLPPALQSLSHKIFDRISDSFEALLEYEKSKKEGLFEMYKEADSILFGELSDRYMAEVYFLEGVRLYHDKQFQLASEPLNSAGDFNTNDAEYQTFRILNSRWTDGSEAKSEEIIQQLKRALDIDSHSIPTLLALAEAFENALKKTKAYEWFSKAATLEPENKMAIEGAKRTRRFFQIDEDSHKETDENVIKTQEAILRQFLVDSEIKTLYEILDVPQNASGVEIRRAYFSLAKEFHPDRFGGLKRQPLAEDVFQRINEAYDILSSDSKKRLYDRSLRNVELEKKYRRSQERIQDQKLFTKALSMLNERLYDEAIGIWTELDSQRDGCAKCKAYIGYARYLRDSKTSPVAVREAEQYFEQAVKIDPGFVETYVLRGKMLRMLGQHNKALKSLQKAAEIDPDHVDALREIRFINQRKAQDPNQEKTKPRIAPKEDKKGIFGSFFGKKK